MKAILADEKKLLAVIKEEITIIADKYGDDRRTAIGYDDDMSMEDLIPDEDTVIAMTHLGYIKRMDVDNFRSQNRGGKGVICYKITEKTGCLIGAKLVDDGREIMMITTEGIVIRMVVDDISVIGRNTSGVKLMAIDHDSDIKVASIAKVRESVTKDSNVYNEEYIEDENSDSEEESEETEGDESGSEA